MKRMKRWIVLILSLILTCTLVAVGVWANTPDASAELKVHHEVIPYEVNPAYEGVITLEDLDLPELSDKQPDASILANGEYVSEAEAVKEIRQHMKERKETFDVWVLSDELDYNAQFSRMFNDALNHTGDPTEGDYLQWHWSSVGGSVYWENIGGQYRICYTYSLSYYTSAEQEAELTAAVDQLLQDLNLGGKSDYEKICAVYDYLCENITYDYENLEDDTYLLKFTAYAALMDKTAVCQGYASLFYRLMLELGIDSRLIAGDGGGPHAWNIVELGDLYYNVDSTWDAGMTEYSFFLKNTWNFVNHYRYLDYETLAFHNEYPMAAEDYTPGVQGEADPLIYVGMCGDDAYWGLFRDGTLYIEGTGTMYKYLTADGVPWYYWKDEIESAVIDEGITNVGDSAFEGYKNLTEVTLASTIETIGFDAFRDCGITQIQLPDGLTTIEQSAFENCALTEIQFPDSLSYIGHAAFRNCKAIESITIPDSVTYLGSSAFMGCSSIQQIQLGTGLDCLYVYTFSSCDGLTEVTIPKHIKSMDHAFSSCINLQSVYVESEVIDFGSFENCTSLTEVILTDNVKGIGTDAFAGCTALSEIHIPASVNYLGNYSFESCTATIYFQGDAPYIDSRAFFKAVITAYYPRNNESWTEDVFKNYDGTVTWVPYGVCEHETELRDVKDPTCTEPGYTGDAYCTLCGALVTRGSEIPPLGHTYEAVVTEPTCTEQGYTTYTCSVCGDTYQDDFVDPIPHSYEAVVTEPTCTEGGYTTYTCTVCGESYVDDYTDPIPHSCEAVVTEPTCTEGGYTTYTCTVCGTSYVGDYTDPVPHSYEAVVTEPTCTEGGYTTYTCTVCGESYVGDYTDPIPHSYEAVVTEPTCTEGGYTTYTCTVCGESYVDDYTDPIPHSYEAVVTEPTCTEGGYTTYTCTVCGESYVGDYTDPIPHSYEAVVTEPTCTEGGYTTYTCTACGESHQDDFVDPLGHLWDDEDAQVKTCVRCGFRFEGFMISFTLDETVPVSSVWIDGVEYPVTASGEGYSVLLEEPDAVSMVVYLYNDPNAEDIHTQYPIGMRVWMLSFADNAYTATYVPEFDDLLQYYGTSIRITGNKGIRMITSLTKSNKSALTGNGLAGYKLLEYGTALCFASDLDGGLPMILGETYVRSNFAYKRDVADPVFSYEGDLMNYTNVLVGFSLDQCKDDIAMRPYIILEDAQGNPVTLYGGIVYRSIGYVALQNRNVFKPGSGSYDYVWEIIHHVYGDQYDADYKG